MGEVAEPGLGTQRSCTYVATVLQHPGRHQGDVLSLTGVRDCHLYKERVFHPGSWAPRQCFLGNWDYDAFLGTMLPTASRWD